jgi:hypothetical protein
LVIVVRYNDGFCHLLHVIPNQNITNFEYGIEVCPCELDSCAKIFGILILIGVTQFMSFVYSKPVPHLPDLSDRGQACGAFFARRGACDEKSLKRPLARLLLRDFSLLLSLAPHSVRDRPRSVPSRDRK